jgi:hypothetical protein
MGLRYNQKTKRLESYDDSTDQPVDEAVDDSVDSGSSFDTNSPFTVDENGQLVSKNKQEYYNPNWQADEEKQKKQEEEQALQQRYSTDLAARNASLVKVDGKDFFRPKLGDDMGIDYAKNQADSRPTKYKYLSPTGGVVRDVFYDESKKQYYTNNYRSNFVDQALRGDERVYLGSDPTELAFDTKDGNLIRGSVNKEDLAKEREAEGVVKKPAEINISDELYKELHPTAKLYRAQVEETIKQIEEYKKQGDPKNIDVNSAEYKASREYDNGDPFSPVNQLRASMGKPPVSKQVAKPDNYIPDVSVIQGLTDKRQLYGVGGAILSPLDNTTAADDNINRLKKQLDLYDQFLGTKPVASPNFLEQWKNTLTEGGGLDTKYYANDADTLKKKDLLMAAHKELADAKTPDEQEKALQKIKDIPLSLNDRTLLLQQSTRDFFNPAYVDEGRTKGYNILGQDAKGTFGSLSGGNYQAFKTQLDSFKLSNFQEQVVRSVTNQQVNDDNRNAIYNFINSGRQGDYTVKSYDKNPDGSYSSVKLSDLSEEELTKLQNKEKLASGVFNEFAKQADYSEDYMYEFARGVANSKKIAEVVDNVSDLAEITNDAKDYKEGRNRPELEKKYGKELIDDMSKNDAGYVTGMLMPYVDPKLGFVPEGLKSVVKNIPEDQWKNTIGDKLMETLRGASKQVGSIDAVPVLGFFGLGASPTFAPGVEKGTDINALENNYKKTALYTANRYSNFLYQGFVGGSSMGLVKPEEYGKYQPEDNTEKVFTTLASAAGSVYSFTKIANAVNNVSKVGTLGELAKEYPVTAQRLKEASTFAIGGQINPDQKNRLETVAKDLLLATPFIFTGNLGPKQSMGLNFTQGFLSAKLDGASDEDAFANGFINLGMDVAFRKLGDKTTGLITADDFNSDPSGRAYEIQKALKDKAKNVFSEVADLKITDKTTTDEIKQAFRNAAKEIHPDKLAQVLGRKPTEAEIKAAELKISKLNTAYDILNPKEKIQASEISKAVANDMPEGQYPSDPANNYEKFQKVSETQVQERPPIDKTPMEATEVSMANAIPDNQTLSIRTPSGDELPPDALDLGNKILSMKLDKNSFTELMKPIDGQDTPQIANVKSQLAQVGLTPEAFYDMVTKDSTPLTRAESKIASVNELPTELKKLAQNIVRTNKTEEQFNQIMNTLSTSKDAVIQAKYKTIQSEMERAGVDNKTVYNLATNKAQKPIAISPGKVVNQSGTEIQLPKSASTAGIQKVISDVAGPNIYEQAALKANISPEGLTEKQIVSKLRDSGYQGIVVNGVTPDTNKLVRLEGETNISSNQNELNQKTAIGTNSQQNKETKASNGKETVWEAAIAKKDSIKDKITKDESVILDVADRGVQEYRKFKTEEKAHNILSKLGDENSLKVPNALDLNEAELINFIETVKADVKTWTPEGNPFKEGTNESKAWGKFLDQIGDVGKISHEDYLKGEPEFKKAVETTLRTSIDDFGKKLESLTTEPLKKPTKPQEIEVPKASITKANKESAQVPISQGQNKLRNSRAYERIVERIDEQFRDQPQYERMNIAEDAARAADYVENNYSDAKKIALGLKPAPEGITDTAVSITVAEKALQDGDYELYSQLERSRSLRQTRRGQEIVAERGRVNENSPAYYINQVAEARINQIFRKTNLLDNISSVKGIRDSFEGNKKSQDTAKAKQKYNDYVEAEAKKVKENISKEKIKIKSAQDIIDMLTC